jgi:hypothetical protein
MLPMPARVCSTTDYNTEGLHIIKLNKNYGNIDIKNLVCKITASPVLE